jgi:hypothetical protein
VPSLTFPDGRLREIPLVPQLTVTRTGQTARTIQAIRPSVAQILSNLLDNAHQTPGRPLKNRPSNGGKTPPSTPLLAGSIAAFQARSLLTG